MTGTGPNMCVRCRHSCDWHTLDDACNLDPTDPATPFRCLGYDPRVDGPRYTCDCPDAVEYSDLFPVLLWTPEKRKGVTS